MFGFGAEKQGIIIQSLKRVRHQTEIIVGLIHHEQARTLRQKQSLKLLPFGVLLTKKMFADEH